MFSKTMGLIGVLICVCLTAIIAMPAFAATPAQGVSSGHAITGAGEAKLLGFAENLTTSLQGQGVDVANLNAALANAQSAIGNANSTAFKDAMKTFNQDIQAGIRDGSIPKTALQGTGRGGFHRTGATAPVMNTSMETKVLGFAENQTASLQGQGVDVTNLNAALANAQSAIGNANSTAFKDAMQKFNQGIQAGIKDGSINKTDLPRPEHIRAGGNHSLAFMKTHNAKTSSAAST